MPYKSSSSAAVVAAAAAAAGHTTMPARAAPQRHVANRHAMRVFGPDSYALLFLLLHVNAFKTAWLCPVLLREPTAQPGPLTGLWEGPDMEKKEIKERSQVK